MSGGDPRRREAMNFAAWIKPKAEQAAFVSRLLQSRIHVILCFRAKEKVRLEKTVDERTGVVRTYFRNDVTRQTASATAGRSEFSARRRNNP